MDTDYGKNNGIYNLAAAVVNQAISTTTCHSNCYKKSTDFYFYKQQFEKGVGRVWFVILGAETLYDDLQKWYAEHETWEQSVYDTKSKAEHEKIPKHYTTTSSVIMSCKYYGEKLLKDKKPF